MDFGKSPTWDRGTAKERSLKKEFSEFCLAGDCKTLRFAGKILPPSFSMNAHTSDRTEEL